MKIRYQFRCYPTEAQKKTLSQTFGCSRFVYNWGLNLRINAFKEGQKINFGKSSAALTQLKKTPEACWLKVVSCVPLQQALRHLDVAYINFFKKRASFPGFKKKHGKQSAEFTKSGFKFNREDGNRSLQLSKVGKLNVKWSRGFKSNPTTVTITKRPSGQYFVSLCLDETKKQMLKTNQSVGVDLGISHLATLSNGEKIENPKHIVAQKKRLERAQRILSRRVKGSGRRNRQRLRVAKIQQKTADSRKDFLNKLTTNLVRRFDVICIEDLNVRGMVRNRKLSKSISDASFGAFKTMLESKAKMYGRETRVVDRFFPSSKTCSDCGHVVESLPLQIRQWECPACGQSHDRDVNAAKNILAAGRVVTAQGGNRRQVKASALKCNSRRTVNAQIVKCA